MNTDNGETRREQNVVVVGGGAAGLAATYSLRKQGVNVTLLEAQDHVGGRVAEEVVDGFHIDIGAQIFDKSYLSVLAACRELGVELYPTSIKGTIVWVYRNGTLHRLGLKSVLLFRVCSPKGLWQMIKFRRKFRKRRKDIATEDYRPMLDVDNGESIADLIRREVGDEFLEDFCEKLFTGVVLCPPEGMGAVMGLRTVWNAYADVYHQFLIPARGAGYFSTALGEACAEDIRVSTPVERIVVKEDGQGTVKVKTQDGLMEADAVICATTAMDALRIISGLPDALQSLMKKVTYSSCCHAVFGLDESPFPKGTYLSIFPRMPGGASSMASFSDSAAVSPRSVPPGKSLVHAYSTTEAAQELFALSDEEIVRRFTREIQQYFPAMPDEPLFTRVYRWEQAVCLAPGGMITEMHRLRQEGYSAHTGLFLAGEYAHLPGVNGAYHSGLKAADEVVSYLSAAPAGA